MKNESSKFAKSPQFGFVTKSSTIKKPQNINFVDFRTGGERGIRTLCGLLTHSGFPIAHVRPLRHLSFGFYMRTSPHIFIKQTTFSFFCGKSILFRFFSLFFLRILIRLP